MIYGLSGLCKENKRIISVFFNLLHNFVCVGGYQLKKFTNNYYVNIHDIIKKLNLILQLHLCFAVL